nr:hypothetical protein [Tanacetum cinerariifolium]
MHRAAQTAERARDGQRHQQAEQGQHHQRDTQRTQRPHQTVTVPRIQLRVRDAIDKQ